MIRVTCPACDTVQEFPDDRAGLVFPCQSCHEPLTVGGPDAELVPPSGRTHNSTRKAFGWAVFAVGLVAGVACLLGYAMLRNGEWNRVSFGLLVGAGAITAVLGRGADRLLGPREPRPADPAARATGV